MKVILAMAQNKAGVSAGEDDGYADITSPRPVFYRLRPGRASAATDKKKA
jgi:hypothetical protein